MLIAPGLLLSLRDYYGFIKKNPGNPGFNCWNVPGDAGSKGIAE